MALFLGLGATLTDKTGEPTAQSAVASIEKDKTKSLDTPFPYSGDDIRERVVIDYGKRTVRIVPDESISLPGLMTNRQRCFIVMSKKDYYLYVYEARANDTIMLARYDCAFGLKKGNKQKRGDMRTPNSTMERPFTISQLADASTWRHDFGDGRGNIKAYGNYFLRLVTPGHSGIGIHGSTNNEVSVPGRASEGCIRLKDADIDDLRRNYAFLNMKVIIKDEYQDDLPFEIRAMHRHPNYERKRHLKREFVLSNEAIDRAPAEQGRVRKAAARK